METTYRKAHARIVSRLVKSFGDGHNHELSQYNILSEKLSQLSISKGFDGILLGNVMCGKVSLDSLLITSFGIFIIEFKSYRGVAKIKINGQKQFQCLNADGSRMIQGKDGGFLNVKGGSMDSPYDQALRNRSVVRKTLCEVFGKNLSSMIHIGVAVVFDGSIAIEGINQIGGDDRKWLTVVDTPGFEKFISYISGENNRGLTPDEQDILIKHLDADANVVEETGLFEQANVLFDLGSYSEAYKLYRRCDPIRSEVRIKTLLTLYRLGNSTDFKHFMSKDLESSDNLVRKNAEELMGMAFFHGSNGFRKDYDKAMVYLRKITDSTSVNEIITTIKNEINRKDIEDKLYRQRKITAHNRNKLLSNARNTYLISGRVIKSLIFIITAVFSIAMLLPELKWTWEIIGITGSFLGCGAVIYFLAENEDIDVWYIKDFPPSHFYQMSFRTINVSDKHFDNGDRLFKTITYIIIFLAYKIIPFAFGYLGVKAIMKWFVSTHYGSIAFDYAVSRCGIDLSFWIPGFMMIYFSLNFIAYAFSIFKQMVEEFEEMYNEGVIDSIYYCVAVPKLLSGAKPEISADISLCWSSIKYGLILSSILMTLGFIKPFLYSLISLLIK